MLDFIWIGLKIALFCGIVVGIHVTSNREMIDIYGRSKLTLVALGAMFLGFLANWFLAGAHLFERQFWHSMKFADNSAVVFFAFGVGLLIQVVRFTNKR